MFRKVTGLHTGRTDLPLLQRDALVDAGTVGLFDFCHGWGYSDMVSPVAGNKNLPNYVRGGADAVNGPADKTWSATSGIRIPDASSSQKVALPAAWVVPADATHVAVGMFAKVDVVPTTASTRNAQIVGCRGETTGHQFSLNLAITNNTGITSFQMAWRGVTFNVPASSFPNDGLMHHFVSEYVQISSTQWQPQLYIDGVLVFAGSVQTFTAGATFLQPDAGTVPAIGRYATGTGSVSAMGVSVPRIWMQNLAAPGSKTIAQMIAQDRAANAARFS